MSSLTSAASPAPGFTCRTPSATVHLHASPPLVHALATRLVPGGVLHAATDDTAYAEQMDEVFAGEPLLENANAPLRWRPEVPGRMHTAYEEQWRAEGRPLHFFAYRRRA